MGKLTSKLFDDDINRDIFIDIIFRYHLRELGVDDDLNLPQSAKLLILVNHLIELYDVDDLNSIFKDIIGKDVHASNMKKIVFESYLKHEGFNIINWVDLDGTDAVFKECDEVARKLAVKHDSNKIIIVAPFYTSKEKIRCMENDKYSWDAGKQIMSSKWIYDVTVYDNRETSYDDLYKYIESLHAIRWNPPLSVN